MTAAETAQTPDTAKDHRLGAIYAGLAFVLWGFNPAFFKVLSHVTADEILAHRIVWAVVFVAILVSVGQRWRTVARALRTPRLWLLLLITATLLSGNWLVYIWAVNSGQVLETSLGYFINPLLSVVIGMVMLRERLSRLQTVAVVLATVAVLILTVSFGRLPWISLWLAGTFGIYGYLRKGHPGGIPRWAVRRNPADAAFCRRAICSGSAIQRYTPRRSTRTCSC